MVKYSECSILFKVVSVTFKQTNKQNLSFSLSLLGLYLESEPVSSTSNSFQPREFSSCVSCEENMSCIDQVFESYLQTETHLDPLLNPTQSTSPYFPDSFQAAPFCFNQSLVIYLCSLQNLIVASSGVVRLCKEGFIISWEITQTLSTKKSSRKQPRSHLKLSGGRSNHTWHRANLWVHTIMISQGSYTRVKWCEPLKRFPGNIHWMFSNCSEGICELEIIDLSDGPWIFEF